MREFIGHLGGIARTTFDSWRDAGWIPEPHRREGEGNRVFWHGWQVQQTLEEMHRIHEKREDEMTRDECRAVLGVGADKFHSLLKIPGFPQPHLRRDGSRTHYWYRQELPLMVALTEQHLKEADRRRIERYNAAMARERAEAASRARRKWVKQVPVDDEEEDDGCAYRGCHEEPMGEQTFRLGLCEMHTRRAVKILGLKFPG